VSSRLSEKQTGTYNRTLRPEFSKQGAFILFGPRKTGKTTLLRHLYPKATWFDLLDTDLRQRLELRPAELKEIILDRKPKVIVIDEIQKVPALLDEIHWCLENTDSSFVLCGSSARSLKRETSGLIGGRAWRFDLFPLTTHELGASAHLDKILKNGTIPAHYNSEFPDRDFRAYVSDYIEEEIRKEAHLRNVPAFFKFLEFAGRASGDLVNYANIGRECGVSPKTVREYYQILEDTLLGFRLAPFKSRGERRLIETEKFYLFDCGLTRYLKGITTPEPRTDVYGHLFEAFIIQEVRAYLSYHEKRETLTFWRTSTQMEVDLIIGNGAVAIEIKSSDRVQPKDLKGLRSFSQDRSPQRKILVCRENRARQTEDGIEILPWDRFCHLLWSNKIV
jgi:uncharacterized protein